MNKKHTAESLRFYLGKNVLIKNDNYQAVKKIHQLSDSNEVLFHGDKIWTRIGIDGDIYPVLKTVYEMTIDDFRCIYGYETGCLHIEYDTLRLGPKQLNNLVERGYAAIPNKHSPTSYSDVFDMPCVCDFG